jgi:flagellar basal-body rod protein FlgG
MLNSLNAAASGMTAQAKQVEVISNNLANADTVGFKKSRTEFQDLLYQNVREPGAATSATTQNPTGVNIGNGVQVSAVSREHGQGSLRQTERELDMAIGGAGFFSVQMPNGELGYTRDGSFQLGPEGQLITTAGYSVQPEILIPQGTKSVVIAADGRVTASDANGQSTEIGQVQLVSFANPSGLRPIGGNLYTGSQGSGAPVPGNPGEGGLGAIFQKTLESSNVSPVTEMTDLIRAQRVYELNSKVITSSDQMMSTLSQIK